MSNPPPSSSQFLVLLAPIIIIAGLTVFVLCLRSCYVGRRRKRLAQTRIAVEPWNRAWFVAVAPPDNQTLLETTQNTHSVTVNQPPEINHPTERQLEEHATVVLTAAQQVRVMAALDSAEREDSDYIEPLQYTTMGSFHRRMDYSRHFAVPTPAPSQIAASPMPIVAMNRYVACWASRCNYQGAYTLAKEPSNQLYNEYYLANQRFLPSQLNADLPPTDSTLFLGDITGQDARVWAHIYRPRSGGGAVTMHGGNESTETYDSNVISIRTAQTITWRKRRERSVVAAIGLRPRVSPLSRTCLPTQDPLVGTYFEVLLSVWGPPPSAEDLAIQESLQEAALEAMNYRREMQEYEQRTRVGADAPPQAAGTISPHISPQNLGEKSEYHPANPSTLTAAPRRRTLVFEPPPPYFTEVDVPSIPQIPPSLQTSEPVQTTHSAHNFLDLVDPLQEKTTQQTLCIGVTTRPYPPFLLPGRFQTSVALVVDNGVHLVVSRPGKRKGGGDNCEYVHLSSEYIDSRWRCRDIVAGDVVGCGLFQRGTSWNVYFTLNGKPIVLYPDPSIPFEQEGIMLEQVDVLDSRHFVAMEIGTMHGGPAQLFPNVGGRGHVSLLTNFSGKFVFPFGDDAIDDEAWIRDMCVLEADAQSLQ